MINYLKSLIDKNNPASAQTFLTIITVFVLLFATCGITVACFWKPLTHVLWALLTSICSLVGIQSIQDIKSKFDHIIKSDTDDDK